MSRVVISHFGGIGNSILVTPLIKALLNDGYGVLLDFSIVKIPETADLFRNWARKEERLLVGSTNDADFRIKLPYCCDSVSPFTGETLRWGEVLRIGEANLYARIYPKTEKRFFEETVPLWDDSEVTKFSNEFSEYIAFAFESDPEFKSRIYWKADELAQGFDKVVWLGKGNGLLGGSADKGVNMIGRLSLSETASLIKSCKGFLGTDGGLAHIAAAVGVPTVILFGPTSEVKNRPIGPHINILSLNIDCRPCQARGASMTNCERGFTFPLCMDFEPDEVIEAAKQIFSETR